MSSDDLYKNIGFAVVVIFFIYIVYRVIKFQNNVLEGFRIVSKDKNGNVITETNANYATRMKEIDNALKNKQELYRVDLNITSNKKIYDSILYSQYNNVIYNMTSMMVEKSQAISLNPGSSESLQVMNTVNAMKEYAKSLEYVSEFVEDMAKTNKAT